MSSVQLEDANGILTVDAVGLSRLTKHGSSDSLFLSHLGYLRVAAMIKEMAETADECDLLLNQIACLPATWVLQLMGVKANLSQLAEATLKLLGNFEKVILHRVKDEEAAVCDEAGKMIVLLQSDCHLGIPRTLRSTGCVSVSIARQPFAGPCIGAVLQASNGKEMRSLYQPEGCSLEIATWNLGDKDALRSLLSELGVDLKAIPYCGDAGLLRFAIGDSTNIKPKNKLVRF